MANSIPNIIKEAYYTGQLLGKADFDTAQDFQSQEREFQTQQLVSPGVLTGLTVTNGTTSLNVAAGAAINSVGKQILLTTDKSIDVKSEATGDYKLTIAYNFTAVDNSKNQLQSMPVIALTTTQAANTVLLADVSITSGQVTTLTASSTQAKLYANKVPQQEVSNLNASVITSGQFTSSLIPDLQNLNGKLTASQLPTTASGISLIEKTVFSPGIITDLEVTNTGLTILLTKGAALDSLGNQIILGKNATYLSNGITPKNGKYSLDMSAASFQNKTWLLVISNNTTDTSSPVLEILESTSVTTGKTILATITVTTDSLTVTTDGRIDLLLESSRISDLTADQVPKLQNLNGKLTASQLPATASGISLIDKTVFSPGIIKGLVVTNTNLTILLAKGSVLDSSGNQIILGKNATYLSNGITPKNGKYSLDMSAASFQSKTWLLLISNNSADTSSPVLEILESTTVTTGKTILATITVTTDSLTVTNDGRVDLLLESSRIPDLTADQVPEIENLKGALNPAQVPSLDKLTGTLSASQIGTLTAANIPNINTLNGTLVPKQVPDLSKLNGTLTKNQLPTDIGGAKEYLTFWVDSPIIYKGGSTNINWKSDNGVDQITLSYFSVNGITTLTNTSKVIQLSETGYMVTPSQSGTYTITAQVAGKVVTQSQVHIQVLTEYDLAQMYKESNVSAVECVNQLKKYFKNTEALTVAKAMASSGYSLSDTGKAVQKSFGLGPTELGQLIAAAFPSK